MIKTRINNEYKDIIKIFGGGTLQKEIIKVWSGEAQEYVYESSVEYTGTLPITINANGDLLLDYRIYGNTTQTGTPTPESPIMPIGCGERTENLWNRDEVARIQVTSDASIERYGIAFSGSAFSLCLISDSTMFYKIKTDNTYETATQLYAGMVVTITLTDNQTLLVYGSNLGLVLQATIQINSGTSYIPYEPYGYKLPMTISNGDTVQTIPIYLGEAETTRRIEKLVLTGEETFVATTVATHYRCRTTLVPKGITKSPTVVLSTHYFMSAGARDGAITLTTDGGSVYFTDDTNAVTVETFKSYLAAQYAAGTPVTVWYVLEEPKTAVVNEPLMKIGDYADTIDSAQATVQIPTFAGTTIIDYDGTPKPSQMHIKYRR